MNRILFFLLLSFEFVLASYPLWLKDGLKIQATFEDSNLTKGYGIVFEDGLILTSASVVYSKSRANDILLYHSESFDEPISCLSHADIIALDDNLDIAILKPIKFTDIYCNIMPEPNARSLHFKNRVFKMLVEPFNLPVNSRIEISYFLEQDWLEFGRERIWFDDYMKLDVSDILGMPLFVEDEFLGIVSKKHKNNILLHGEILDFICEVSNKTSVFKDYKSVLEFCSRNIK